MEQVTDLLPMATPRLPGCPDALTLLELRLAWRRFCIDTEAWRTVMDMSLLPARATFVLPLPYEGHVSITRLGRVWRELDNGQEQTPGQDEYRLAGEWGAPAVIFRQDLPTEGTLHVEAAIAPRAGLQDPPVDPELLDRHGDEIAAGAVMRLAGMRGRRWYDPELAAMSQYDYLRAVAEAKAERVRERRPGLATLFGPSTRGRYQAGGDWARVFGE